MKKDLSYLKRCVENNWLLYEWGYDYKGRYIIPGNLIRLWLIWKFELACKRKREQALNEILTEMDWFEDIW